MSITGGILFDGIQAGATALYNYPFMGPQAGFFAVKNQRMTKDKTIDILQPGVPLYISNTNIYVYSALVENIATSTKKTINGNTIANKIVYLSLYKKNDEDVSPEITIQLLKENVQLETTSDDEGNFIFEDIDSLDLGFYLAWTLLDISYLSPPAKITAFLAYAPEISSYFIFDSKVSEQQVCSKCNGTGIIGRDGGNICPYCDGDGIAPLTQLQCNIEATCPIDCESIQLSIIPEKYRCFNCNGFGKILNESNINCPKCSGKAKFENVIDNSDNIISEFDCAYCNGIGKVKAYDECPICHGALQTDLQTPLTEEQLNLLFSKEENILQLQTVPTINEEIGEVNFNWDKGTSNNKDIPIMIWGHTGLENKNIQITSFLHRSTEKEPEPDPPEDGGDSGGDSPEGGGDSGGDPPDDNGIKCDVCGGTGFEPGTICQTCNGEKQVFCGQEECPECNGRGEIDSDEEKIICTSCEGSLYDSNSTTYLNVEINLEGITEIGGVNNYQKLFYDVELLPLNEDVYVFHQGSTGGEPFIYIGSVEEAPAGNPVIQAVCDNTMYYIGNYHLIDVKGTPDNNLPFLYLTGENKDGTIVGLYIDKYHKDNIIIDIKNVCSLCNGSGIEITEGITQCPTCNGEKFLDNYCDCETCKGTGNDVCRNCGGDGYLDEGDPGYNDCLAEGTLITLNDGSKRPIEQIQVGDYVMDKNKQPNYVTYLGRHLFWHEHILYTFEDGTIIDEVNKHRFYNVEQGFYQLLKNWKIGEHALNENNELIALIDKKVIKEPKEQFAIYTNSGNYYANGLLTGQAFCNKEFLSEMSAEQAIDMLLSIEDDNLLFQLFNQKGPLL